MAEREAVGVLGGSFDPVHRGHLTIARRAREALGLGRVLFVLSPRPPHKDAASLTDPAHREAMLRAALEGRDDCAPSRVELERPGTGYTLDTLRALRDGDGLAPVFILGMDSLAELHTWRDYRDLVREFDLVAVDREGTTLEQARARLDPDVARRLVALAGDGRGRDGRAPAGAGGRIFHLPIEPIRVSSSAVRRRAAAGEPLDDLVPREVAMYIREQGLYREAVEDSTLSPSMPEPVAAAVRAAFDKKAHDPVVLDLRGISDVTDHFVICHGTSDRQVQAIADGIERTLREELKLKPVHVEGRRSADWILMDYIDFVVHLFSEDRRGFYRLERLWGDAPRCDVSGLEGDASASRGASAR